MTETPERPPGEEDQPLPGEDTEETEEDKEPGGPQETG